MGVELSVEQWGFIHQDILLGVEFQYCTLPLHKLGHYSSSDI